MADSGMGPVQTFVFQVFPCIVFSKLILISPEIQIPAFLPRNPANTFYI